MLGLNPAIWEAIAGTGWGAKAVPKLVFAEAVEEHEEEGADDGVYGGADGEVHGEPRFGLGEQEAAGEDDDALVDAEEDDG